MMDCKQALTEAKGDMEQAVVVLRKKGVSVAAKKAARVTSEGSVTSYIHAGGKIGVLLEVNCESDFVARTEDFKELVHDIAMHIAASDPKYIRKEDVTAEDFAREKDIALARAIAPSPAVLLLDEPFSNLDAKLRERARDWLQELQHALGLTTVFVTHDQDEALSMSDRILVMNSGRILREGTPEEVYRQPRVRFVAEFVGQCNFLTGAIGTGPDGRAVLRTARPTTVSSTDDPVLRLIGSAPP